MEVTLKTVAKLHEPEFRFSWMHGMKETGNKALEAAERRKLSRFYH